MSPPGPELPKTPPASAPPRLAVPRWLDRLTTGLLAASLGVAAGAATPAFLRAAGVELPRTTTAARDAEAPLALPHRPPDILAHEGPPFDPDDDDGVLGEAAGQLGLTRSPLVLHEQPAGAARRVADVEAGELVTIVRFAGDWALVYYGGSSGLVVGWAKKSEIAIR